MAGKLTIQDIARLAGVSKATVSRVLNQKPDVDPATRERILRIMDEQRYTPNIAASGLAGGRTRLIGILIPSLTWPLIPEIMRGVGDVIEKTSYELILYSISDVFHEKDHSEVIDRIIGTKLTSGLLAIYPGPTSQHLAKLHRPEFPVVLLDDQTLPPEHTPWIGVNNRMGAYEATRHLIQLGHRRIAHIQGPLKYQVSHDRYQGYCDALQEAGLALDPALVLQGDFMPPSGRACAEALFDLPEPPTAIFAASDYMAYGVLAAAEERGLRIPENVALVGFDDIASSAHMRPPLTTVKQPFYEMGQCAIELLLTLVDMPRPITSSQRSLGLFSWQDNAEGEENGSRLQEITPSPLLFKYLNPSAPDREPIRIQLATTLVVRESCGASYHSRPVNDREASSR